MIKFVPDIKPRLKHYSTIALGLGAALMSVHTMYPDLIVTAIGDGGVKWYMRSVLAVLVFGLIGKFVVQDAPKGDQP